MQRRTFLITMMTGLGALALTAPWRARAQPRPTPTLRLDQLVQGSSLTVFPRLLGASPHFSGAQAQADMRWTLLLPTDAAFAPLGDIEALIEDAAARDALLAGLFIPGMISAARLERYDGVYVGTLLEGAALRTAVTDAGYRLGGAALVERDLLAINGVAHVVDALPVAALPPVDASTIEPAGLSTPAVQPPAALLGDLIREDAARPDTILSGVLQGFQAADDPALLAGLFVPQSRFTLFAPHNDAFTQLIFEQGITAECALEATHAMAQVFANHIVPGRFASADFVRYAEASDGSAQFLTLNGRLLTFTPDGLDSAAVLTADLPAANGVLHIVDHVLMPPGL